jgi:hypothetical protein
MPPVILEHLDRELWAQSFLELHEVSKEPETQT